MSADEPPLIFAPKLGGLFPVNAAAREAMKAIAGEVTVTVKRAKRNQRRRSLYWCVAEVVCEVMNDLHGLDLTEAELHDLTRKRLGLIEKTITLPSGAVIDRLKSTSDRAMQEPERAAYTARAFALWARWTQIDVDTLTREGERKDAARNAA